MPAAAKCRLNILIWHQTAKYQSACENFFGPKGHQVFQQGRVKRQTSLLVIFAHGGAHHHGRFFRVEIQITPAQFLEFTVTNDGQIQRFRQSL